MATYVLVHGGGHGGWSYGPLARLLREAGHEVHTPTLTGLGERAHLVDPHVDLHTHITDVFNTLYYEDLHDVVLVGHSYAGNGRQRRCRLRGRQGWAAGVRGTDGPSTGSNSC